MARPSVAKVISDNLHRNALRVRELAPRSKVMACVKADGYGHGILNVAAAIVDEVDGFAVACIEEAIALRDAGFDLPILLLEGPQTEDEVSESAARRLMLCMSTWRQIEWLEACATKPDSWLKIDTGMHRLGFAPDEAAAALARLQAQADTDHEIVVCSHFACADEPAHAMNAAQVDVFDNCVRDFDQPQSLANSAAIMTQKNSHRDWVRPGYMLYGGSPFHDKSPTDLGLHTTMDFLAEVISVRSVCRGETVGYGAQWVAGRDSTIATVAVGYGDGYPRHAGSGTPVMIDGHMASLAGRVSMDMITVDVTDLPAPVHAGATARLWGDGLSVDRIAACANTIGYELMAGMPKRIPRVLESP